MKTATIIENDKMIISIDEFVAVVNDIYEYVFPKMTIPFTLINIWGD